MKIARLITLSILAFGFLFNAPLQWGANFAHAQSDMSMDMGMDHEAAQDCFEHCMSQASQMAEFTEIAAPIVVAVVNIAAESFHTIEQDRYQQLGAQEPPGQKSVLLTIQKRE